MRNDQMTVALDSHEQHSDTDGVMSWPRTVWLYLSPGVPVLILYVVGGRWLEHRHQPADLALAAGFLLFAFPVELSRALHASRRANGTLSLTGGGDFRAKLGPASFLRRAALLTVVAFALLVVTLPLTTALADGPLHFMPDFLLPSYNWTTLPGGRRWLLIVGVLLLVVNGLLIPWVEEVYYRGYLLSRTPGRRGVAIVIGGVLFALEHLWQPQNWPLIAALAIALGWSAYRWRTIWVGFAVHAFANSFGILVLMIALVRR
jgi:membrane protease YdiL (CAAX protease family)